VVQRTFALAAGLLLTACSAEGRFAPPRTVDSGSFEKVDRTVENQLMDQAVTTLEGLELEEPFGAAYEFLPYKPQFFLGAGKGNADRQAVIDAVLPLFGGDLGLSEPPHDVPRDGVRFLCAPYSHTGVPGTQGTGGLASISAICTWSDGEIAGFGVGVAGLAVEDVARMAAEAHTEFVE
jgi:hypothetical protein